MSTVKREILRLSGEFCESAEFAWSEDESRSFIIPARFAVVLHGVEEALVGLDASRRNWQLSVTRVFGRDEESLAIQCTRSLCHRDGAYISTGFNGTQDCRVSSYDRYPSDALRKFYTSVAVNAVILKRHDAGFLVVR